MVDRISAAVGSPNRCLATVIITAHNGAHGIGDLVADLAAQRRAGPFEVIVVADRCTDETEVAARHRSLPLRILRHRLAPEKGRTARQEALTLGAGAARGELLLFTDADVRLPPDWISRIREHLSRHQVICGPVHHRGESGVWSAYLTLDSALNHGVCRALHILGLRSGGFGANLALTRSCYDASGGYAHQAPTLTEDRALVQQSEDAGARVIHAAAPVVRVRSVSDPGAIIRRGRRVLSGARDPAALVFTLGGLSLLIPLSLALVWGGPWWQISLWRYLFGVVVFAALLLRVRAASALPWALCYEPVAMCITVAIMRSLARNPVVHWGGLDYRLPMQRRVPEPRTVGSEQGP